MSVTQREISTPHPPALIHPDDLRGLQPIRRLPGRNLTKADILVYLCDGREVAVKDYGARPWLLRQSVGRWLVRREAAAYRAAGGVLGLAPFLGRLGPFALATLWIEGRPLFRDGPLPADTDCFDQLRKILDRLHERGIALGDLHHRDVILVAGGAVAVVDLATAWVLGPSPGPIRRMIFEHLREVDLVALARMRARFSGQDPTAAVAGVGRRAAAWHRRGRSLKRLWNRLRGREGRPDRGRSG